MTQTSAFKYEVSLIENTLYISPVTATNQSFFVIQMSRSIGKIFFSFLD